MNIYDMNKNFKINATHLGTINVLFLLFFNRYENILNLLLFVQYFSALYLIVILTNLKLNPTFIGFKKCQKKSYKCDLNNISHS